MTLNGNKQRTSCLSHFIPRKERHYLLNRRLGRHWNWSGQYEEGVKKKKPLHPARIQSPHHPHCSIVTIQAAATPPSY